MMQRTVWRAVFVGGWLAACSPAWAVNQCTQSCANLTVGSGDAAPGHAVMIPISFTQGPNDNAPNQGNDDVAAIAFTIGLPGTGNDTPLSLADCNDTDGDGLPDAVSVDPAVRDNYRVV